MSPRIPLAWAAVVVLCGCSGGQIGPASGEDLRSPQPAPADAAIVVAFDLTPPPPPPSSNPIDVAVWPRFVASGHTQLELASTRELCRRIALDFTGAPPSVAELTSACDGHSVDEMLDHFLASPAYLERERKLWIQWLGEDPARVLADDLVDADRIITALASGAIGYDDFVAQIMAHPVMTLWQRTAPAGDQFPEDAAEHAFTVLLGRTASPAERSDLGNLLKVWQRSWRSGGPQGYGTYVHSALLLPSACRPFGCSSNLLGAPGVTTTVNLDKLISDAATCMLPLDNGASGPVAGECFAKYRGAPLPEALRLELEKPGRLLATRREVWDQAVDRALHRLLGWWKSSAAEPDTIVPEVREAAVAWLRADSRHDLRGLYRLIAGSILYRQSSSSGSGDERTPAWFMGPLKMMEPEQFLDSTSRALGVPLAACDPHTAEKADCTSGMYKFGSLLFPRRLRKDAAILPKPCDDDYFYYHDIGQLLGGCQGGLVPSPTQASMPTLLGHIVATKRLCTAAPPLPPGFNVGDGSAANIDRLVVFEFQALLGRAPDADEASAINKGAAECLPDMSCGLPLFARELCGAIVRSGSFLFY